eukprot:TRINITY_DN2264_c0_g1_i2.p1 TRINITY_DN2264_c0_g1~~TRINITY_DN2264_c0_g1_i2.p1  ORF type:complete len:231 (+),score=127.55 TRINITY_DN2264_c0_g1_i2:30-695(+)
MTTAHRPTWNAAMGGKDQGGSRRLRKSTAYSSKDLPAHMTMKYRSEPVVTKDAQSLKAQLEAKETLSRLQKKEEMRKLTGEDEEHESINTILALPSSASTTGSKRTRLLALPKTEDKIDFSLDADDADDSDDESSDDEEEIKRALAGSAPQAKTVKKEELSDDEDDDENDDSEDDSDEDEELMRELERLRKEKEEERQKKVFHPLPLIKTKQKGNVFRPSC